jgi:hypothetical protein
MKYEIIGFDEHGEAYKQPATEENIPTQQHSTNIIDNWQMSVSIQPHSTYPSLRSQSQWSQSHRHRHRETQLQLELTMHMQHAVQVGSYRFRSSWDL